MEYKKRSVRLDDECWEAVKAHEMSANRLLRMVLGLDKEAKVTVVPVVSTGATKKEEFVTGERVVFRNGKRVG